MTPPTESARSDPSVRQGSLLGKPAVLGLTLGLMFWLAASTPTLIPRSWAVQGMVGGVSFALGYGIGALIGRIARPLRGRWDRTTAAGGRRQVLAAVGVVWLFGVVLGAALWVSWQNAQRAMMGLEPIGSVDALLMVASAAVVGAGLVLVGRTVSKGIAAIDRFSHRHAPAALAMPLTLLLVVAVIMLFGGVALGALTVVTDRLFASIDDGTIVGDTIPASASVSGSSESLVAWTTLGRWGRHFVATATTADELAAFHGPDVEVAIPVRVFVGLRSADSIADGARLAVRELERAGGFERAVLAVWVPTGSGWAIPDSAVALEQLHHGDTAIVALQYSFLPSLISTFLEAGRPAEAGEELFAAVYSRWAQLPPEGRPKLVLFGKSLGTTGVEAPFVGKDASESVAHLQARTDGALIVGAPLGNPIHMQLTDERDPGSHSWQPVFDGGRSVRFLNRDPDQPALDLDWPTPRIVYLQHSSDPVPFWGLDALWRPPEWMDRPRGNDVPDETTWFPIVSAVQAVADLILQLDTPPGFGHVYSTDYVTGWALVVPPAGWTQADTERLTEHLDTGSGESEP